MSTKNELRCINDNQSSQFNEPIENGVLIRDCLSDLMNIFYLYSFSNSCHGVLSQEVTVSAFTILLGLNIAVKCCDGGTS